MLVPLPTSVPQQLPAYQSTVHPAATDALRVDDPPPHILEGLAAAPVGTAGPDAGVIVMLSNAQALFDVVTDASRKMVTALDVAVTLPENVTQAVLVVPELTGAAAARDVPPAGSARTVAVAEAELVRM